MRREYREVSSGCVRMVLVPRWNLVNYGSGLGSIVMSYEQVARFGRYLLHDVEREM